MDTQPIHILSTLRLEECLLERVRGLSPRLRVRQQTCRNEEEVTAALTPETEILWSFHVPRDLAGAPSLRWVQLHQAGADGLLGYPALAPDSAVLVTTASGIHAPFIGEWVLGSILYLNGRFAEAKAMHQARQWPGNRRERFARRSLRGLTVGIVGYGSIGREVARLAATFGMRILALKFNPLHRADRGYVPDGLGDPQGALPERFFGPEQRLAMLAECDFVVLALPLTEATRAFVGAAEFAAMKPSAYFINIARGQLVDEAAMIAAVQGRRIAGVALDVFTQEPLPPDSPIWNLDPDRVLLSPHVSGFSLTYDDDAMLLFAENVRRYLGGQPLLNEVDRRLHY
ncbi:MAG: D-2-hydroxyacid dehydrogenase [Chloroflexi bacterium]|nr:D-2-hydroxyacid dehydrogenase [Chloroflexota bacterium]